MRATVFGARGFLGRHLLSALAKDGYDATGLARGDWPAPGSDLGDVIYTIGMNANFRGRPFETYDAHISTLISVLRGYRFRSFLYVSSTRVYLGAMSTTEAAPLRVEPSATDQTFNISKIAGEALCLSLGDPSVRIARISNLYGADDASDVFLTAVMREAIRDGSVVFRTAPDSAKDYLHVDDAVDGILRILRSGEQPIYNVACGQNRSNSTIAALLASEGKDIRFEEGAPLISFPPIETAALRTLGFNPGSLDARFAPTFRAMAARATGTA